jgi:hypothetical protein
MSAGRVSIKLRNFQVLICHFLMRDLPRLVSALSRPPARTNCPARIGGDPRRQRAMAIAGFDPGARARLPGALLALSGGAVLVAQRAQARRA